MRGRIHASVSCWSAGTAAIPTARYCGNCPNAPLSLGASVKTPNCFSPCRLPDLDTRQRQLLVSGDGSYTNRTVLRQLPERTTFIGRIRKDAKLFLALPPTSVTR